MNRPITKPSTLSHHNITFVHRKEPNIAGVDHKGLKFNSLSTALQLNPSALSHRPHHHQHHHHHHHHHHYHHHLKQSPQTIIISPNPSPPQSVCLKKKQRSERTAWSPQSSPINFHCCCTGRVFRGATAEACGSMDWRTRNKYESSSKHVHLGIELGPVDQWLQNHIPHQVFTFEKTGMWEWPSVSYPEWRVVEWTSQDQGTDLSRFSSEGARKVFQGEKRRCLVREQRLSERRIWI